jgi:hypothetical protein
VLPGQKTALKTSYINISYFILEIIMSVSQELLNAVESWKVEDEKFAAGNNAAGTRARKALQEIAKLVKTRRGEITEEKTARKEAKA